MTQLLILALSLIGVAIRLRTRRLTQVEWALLLFVVINIFLVQLQMFVGENGKLVWILRYHQAALTFLYGWAAWSVVEAAKRARGWVRVSVVGVAALWLVATGGTSLWRIVKHSFVESKRNAQMLAAHWAACVIAEDWDGPKLDKEHFFTIQEYHPSRRPIILSVGGYMPYITKGRWYSLSSDVRKYEKPDYAFLPEGVKVPPGMKCIAEKSYGKKKRKFRIFRREGRKCDIIGGADRR